MEGSRPNSRQVPQRRDRLLGEHEHDTYKLPGKLPDPTACTECGAMYRRGRWTWGSPPVDAHPTLCPACQRIRDNYPGGYLRLGGPFVAAHRDELLALARSVEVREKGEHPLKRIIEICDEDGGLLITTADPNLARNIGDAIHNAYRGELDYHYAPESSVLRVRWSR